MKRYVRHARQAHSHGHHVVHLTLHLSGARSHRCRISLPESELELIREARSAAECHRAVTTDT